MNTPKKQSGLSMLAWMVILGMAGVFIVTGLKLTPVYLQFYNIVGVIEQLKSDPELKQAPKSEVVNAFQRRLDVEGITLQKNEYSVTKVEGKPIYEINIHYEVRRPLFGNLSIVVSFERSEQVGGG